MPTVSEPNVIPTTNDGENAGPLADASSVQSKGPNGDNDTLEQDSNMEARGQFVTIIDRRQVSGDVLIRRLMWINRGNAATFFTWST